MDKRFEAGNLIDDMKILEVINDNKARPRYVVKCIKCGYIRDVNAWTFEAGRGTSHLSCSMHLKRTAAGEERSILERLMAVYNMSQQRVKPDYHEHQFYHDRGITNEFVDWMHFYNTMRPTYFLNAQLDRKDNKGPYSPANCRWVTAKENSRNRRSNVPVEVTRLADGKVFTFDTVVEFIEHFDLPRNSAAYRVIDAPTRSYKGFQIKTLTGEGLG